jgi:hypothetical protein
MPDPGRCFYVYVLFRPWDGSPLYVGKGKGDRWLHHRRPKPRFANKHFLAVINKARELGLEVPCLKIRDNLTEAEAFAIEAAFIAAIGRGNDGPLVNATAGGEGTSGLPKSSQTRAKLRAANLGNQNSKGRKESAETRTKRVATFKATLEKRGPKPPSIAARANMRKGQLERFATEESRIEHGERLKGTQSGEALEKKRTIKKDQWADPDYRAVTVAKFRERANDNDVAAQRSQTTKELWTNPEYRAKQHGPSFSVKHGIAMKDVWADPVRRAAMLEARRLKAEIRRQRRLAQSEPNLHTVG